MVSPRCISGMTAMLSFCASRYQGSTLRKSALSAKFAIRPRQPSDMKMVGASICQ
jgi:hypothetical protein